MIEGLGSKMGQPRKVQITRKNCHHRMCGIRPKNHYNVYYVLKGINRKFTFIKFALIYFASDPLNLFAVNKEVLLINVSD